jgi:hypothetical protein
MFTFVRAIFNGKQQTFLQSSQNLWADAQIVFLIEIAALFYFE